MGPSLDDKATTSWLTRSLEFKVAYDLIKRYIDGGSQLSNSRFREDKRAI